MDPKPAAPLQYARRNETSTPVKSVGTIATDPHEVDRIVTPTWQTIYDGHRMPSHLTVQGFMQAYGGVIPIAKTHDLTALSSCRAKAICTNAAARAGGTGGWKQRETSLLSDSCFTLLASLLNTIEDGIPWPESKNWGELAFLSQERSYP